MNEDQIERIEHFLSGLMTEEESNAFLSELEGDPELKQLYHQHKFLKNGFAGLQVEELEKKLRLDEEPAARPVSIQRSPAYRYLSIAAMAIVLAGISFLLFRPPLMQRLAKRNYDAPFAQIQRSNPPPQDTTYLNAMAAFGSQDWKKAITLFEMVSDTHRLYKRALYYRAHSYVGLNEYEAAHAIFSNPAFTEGQYVYQADWNRVLMRMYLKHPTREIISNLEIIADDSKHFFNERAILLLEKLKKK